MFSYKQDMYMRGRNSVVDMITHITLPAKSLYYSFPQQRHTKLYHKLCWENAWEREIKKPPA